MINSIEISVLPKVNSDNKLLEQQIAQYSNLEIGDFSYKVIRRSIDARQRPVKFQLTIDLYIGEPIPKREIHFDFKKVTESSSKLHIIGAGPAGLFAALEALENGVKPVLIERGKKVNERRFDLAKISKEHIVNPESNYCFGEGGAGTYSDGKLYTRSKKKGSVKKILEQLVYFGADEDVLVDAHPHIGTNKLPKIIENIREEILIKGGEIHFESKLTDIKIENNRVRTIILNHDKNNSISCERLVLATGHSARDIYTLLHKKEITLEFKPFAMGVRVEHSQEHIDAIQYGIEDRGEYLPPASYNMAHNTKERGVYTFCMCPGGIIAPCATADGEVVTNGWSPSKRNNPYANSGVVTQVNWEDISDFHQYGPLAGMEFQRSVEQKCWHSAGKTQKVPAQRMLDFLEGKVSKDFPRTSYFPGLCAVDLNTVLPQFMVLALREGLQQFNKKKKGFLTNDAVLHAIESRTSSPVRIPRNKDTLEHIQIKGLYPCAEGAGYAGGIVSAAIDGQRIVKALVEY